MNQDIVLVADYHDRETQFRWFDPATGEERLLRVPSEPGPLLEVVQQARRTAAERGAGVVFIMESTSGWARVKSLVAGQVRFVLANVLAIAQPPKARRRKTDKLDTARLLQEYRDGRLEESFQPPPSLRRLRRLVGWHQNLVRRRTAVRNWINRYLAHETWRERRGLWSERGLRKLRHWARGLPSQDRFTVQARLQELAELEQRLQPVEARLTRIGRRWKPARQLDAIKGIGPLGATAIAACIGPVQRFASAESIIAYAGLAPAVRQTSDHLQHGRLGGGGTDALLRHYLLEASVWARQIPRYAPAYQRVLRRRGPKVARVVVARRLVRSIDAVLRRGVAFEPQAA